MADPDDSEIGSYYELRVDQAISQYVASHLALTDAGLYVLKDENGYKLLCADSGVSVIDPDGHVVTTYGESITFDGSRRQYIGNSICTGLEFFGQVFFMDPGKSIPVSTWFYIPAVYQAEQGHLL